MQNYPGAAATLQKALMININFKEAENLLKKVQKEIKKQGANGNGHTNGH